MTTAPPRRTPAAPARRTQAARRADTQKKLLDAAAEVLIEEGYAGATVQRICARAEVSQGGLFRHYATTEALMVAVAEHVGQQLLDRYQRDFVRLRAQHVPADGETPLALALELVRKACRSRINHAWYELMLAARTRPELHKALRPMMRRYYDDIEALARALLPALAERLGPSFRVLVETILCIFDGEALHRVVLSSPEVEAARLALLPRLLLGAAGPPGERGTPGRSAGRAGARSLRDR